jgi:hypothetical protein
MQPTLRRNISPPSSGSKKISARTSQPPAYLLVLAEIFFDPEDGGDMFLRNFG